MALLVATLVAPRVAAPVGRSSLRLQSKWNGIGRLSSTSLSMSLGRHGYSTRPPGLGKGKRGNGGGVGYRGRAGNNRRPTAASARGRRSSFGEERTAGEGRRGGGSSWDNAGFSLQGRSSRARAAMGKGKGSPSENQYRSSRGGTFSAKGMEPFIYKHFVVVRVPGFALGLRLS